VASNDIEWRIYYSDGSTFDSSQGSPDDAPAWDIQVIAERDGQVGRRLLSKADYYFYLDGCWIGVDDIGLVDYLANVFRVIKVGRQLPARKDFREILEKAQVDPDLPPKSGWLQDEPRD
jgi:hypothetical protein